MQTNKHKLKIAYFAPSFPPVSGGMGSACYYTAKEMAKKYSVTVFCAKRKKITYQKGLYELKEFKPWFSYGYANCSPSIIQMVKKYDIVHLYYPYYGVAEFLILGKIFHKKFPKIIFHHQMDMLGQGITKFFNYLQRIFIQPCLLKFVDHIFILSKDYAEHSSFKKILHKKPQKITVVPNGVDTKLFYPADSSENTWLKKQLKIKAQEKIIFTAQALDKQHFFKGIEDLIKAFAQLINKEKIPAKLIIAGEGNLKKYYQNLAKKITPPNSVIFLGNLNHNELPAYYSLADITAVPSTKSTESFSITAAESMASKTPALVSNLPGLRATTLKNKKLLVKPKNTEDLCHKIKTLIANPNELEQLAQLSRQKAKEHFDWQKIVQTINPIYEQLSKHK